MEKSSHQKPTLMFPDYIVDKGFKEAIINVFKVVKETIFDELQKSMTTMNE